MFISQIGNIISSPSQGNIIKVSIIKGNTDPTTSTINMEVISRNTITITIINSLMKQKPNPLLNQSRKSPRLSYPHPHHQNQSQNQPNTH
jgi:hypothetical protein